MEMIYSVKDARKTLELANIVAPLSAHTVRKQITDLENAIEKCVCGHGSSFT
jgi:hypothetical protein